MKLLVILFAITLFATNSYAANLSSKQIQIDGDTLHFVYSGDKNKQPVIFIHGTPGEWSAFQGYLTNPILQKSFFMVSIDRLGWGKSVLKQRDVETSFAKQSNAIGSIFTHTFPDVKQKWIIVGHSLGASLAPKIAIDFPESVLALLLLSGSIDPKLGKPRWYNYGASTSVISIFLSQDLKRANREIMQLRKELSLMEPYYQNIQSRITIIQGAKDNLVSPKNTNYVEEKFAYLGEKLSIKYLEKANHFLPWNQQQEIIDSLHDLSK